MGRKIYTTKDDGGIIFRSERKAWGVDMPAYVYDLWMPVFGAEAVGVLGTYYRLERDSVVNMTQKDLARAMRIGTDKLSRINSMLEECGFIRVEKPKGNAKRDHHTSSIITLDPPASVSAKAIQKYGLEPYQPLAKWLVEGSLKQPQNKDEGEQENLSGDLTEIPNQGFEENLGGYSTIILIPLDTEPSIEPLKESAAEAASTSLANRDLSGTEEGASAETHLIIGNPENETQADADMPETLASSQEPPPVPPSPPQLKLSKEILFAKLPVSDADFAMLSKTDQQSALFAVVCWQSFRRDPSGVGRGGRQDMIKSKLLEKYPDLTPSELGRAYAAYYIACPGVEMLRDQIKLVDMVGEFREKGRIDAPISPLKKAAATSSTGQKAGFTATLKALDLAAVLAMRGEDELHQIARREAIENMTGNPEFNWFLLRMMQTKNATVITLRQVQEQHAQYSKLAAPIGLQQVLKKGEAEARAIIFLSQIKNWPEDLRLLLLADSEHRGIPAFYVETIQKIYKEHYHDQQ